MLARQQDVLRTASFEPRAHLEGLTLPQNFKLPSMAAVRADGESLSKLKLTGPDPIRTVFFKGSSPSVHDSFPEPLTWNLTIPNLFKFSYYTHVDDVPVDLLEDVIWTLEMFVRVLTESTEKQLRDVGHYLPKQKAEVANYFMLSNTRYKLISHLLCRYIDRPEAALPHLKAAIEEHAQHLKRNRRREPLVESNPIMYFQYAVALTFTNQFTSGTKKMLEDVLKAVTKPSLSSSMNFIAAIVQTHMCLSLVLKEMDVEPDQQKEHTEWAVKWVRKNPKQMEDLEQFVRRRDQPAHPVFVALGAEFFETIPETRTTFQEDERAAKRCRNCGLNEPQVKLSRCTGCLHIYYCSKACQRANWKFHKESCRDRAKSLARSQELKKAHDPKAQQAAEWIKWRDGSHHANSYALIHALGLHRDPSRGRTHIVFRFVEYTPHVSKDIRYRFTVTRAGVFKLSEVHADLESVMGLNPGEGKEYVDGLLTEIGVTSASEDKIPIVDLAFGEGLEPWLSTTGTSLSALRHLQYDPEWRKSVNLKDPVGPMLLRSGTKDAEHIF